MYAQCPACLTTFKIAPAQLTAYGGMVRCGICSAIFHAEQRQLAMPPGTELATTVPQEAPDINDQRSGKNRRAAERRRSRSARAKPAALADDTRIPTVTELKALVKPRFPWRAAFWGIGNLLLLALLSGQFLFFYRDDLAKNPAYRPAVEEFCRYAGCELRALQNVALIDLLQTTIAPHPKYDNALRIRTTLVNRAPYAQAYPWMEISLTNIAGNVIARRTFTPAQYRETPPMAMLAPNVLAATLLDVTNPDGKAVGYEIRLVSPAVPPAAVEEIPVLLHALNALKKIKDEIGAYIEKADSLLR